MPDVVVVGGGAAGCVVAARLSEDPSCEVLLLEAGPDLRTAMPDEVRDGRQPTRSFDWGYTSEPDENGVTRALPRGRLLGGCSSTNATFALRGAPADYDAWGQAGNAGWSFDEVLPFFTRLEQDLDFGDRAEHGSSGPLPIRRYRGDELSDVAAAGLTAFEDVGFESVEDHNAPGAVGAGPIPVNCRDGVRMSTALTYLPADGERPNLTVRCDADVLALTFDASRVTGVRLPGDEVVSADRVVLCAGTYGSPVVLMRSGIGPADHLAALGIEVRNDLPAVGANLADHPLVSMAFGYHEEEPGPTPVFQVAATGHSSDQSSAGPPDLQFLVFGPYPATGELPALFLSGAAVLKPRSRGSVRLRSADPLEPPLIELGYFTEQADLDRLVEAVDCAEELAARPALRSLRARARAEVNVPPRVPAERREWVRRNASTYHHVVGTCAMGPPSDQRAVVDAHGSVLGTEGLFVADASVMPEIPSANTHIPTVMVAERIAERLRSG
jgi:choline dehydrogenase